MQRLLCVTAHPDDEAGGFGGSLLRYSQAGVETHVICLTAGEAATHRGAAKTSSELSEMRRREFAESCKILNVTHGEVLGYPDSALDRVPLADIVGKLVRHIREICPQIVLTFGPEGAVTAHLDHGMTSVFATLAFHWAARSDRFSEQLQQGLKPHRAQKLYYGTALFTMPQRQPVALPAVTAVIDVREYYETKIAAFRAHATQSPLFGIFEGMVRKRGREEMFHLAAAQQPQRLQQETDLFAGVVAE